MRIRVNIGLKISERDLVFKVLRLMFAGYEEVVIEKELGHGFSTSRVFLVEPKREFPLAPSIVKIAPSQVIEQEWNNYQKYVQNHLVNAAQVAGEPVYLSDDNYGGLRYIIFSSETAPPLEEQKREDTLSQLNVEFPLPGLLAINEYFDSVTEKIKAIDFIYSILAILNSANEEIISNLILLLNESSNSTEFPISRLYQFLEVVKIGPLRLVATQYGSPASFDFLGIGKILEVVRDSIKDLMWRGEHEMRVAQLDEKSKQIEINMARLELEKESLEIANRKIQLEKTQLENNKLRLEIATKMLETFEKNPNVKLSENDQKLLLTTLTPKLAAIVNIPATTLFTESDSK